MKVESASFQGASGKAPRPIRPEAGSCIPLRIESDAATQHGASWGDYGRAS